MAETRNDAPILACEPLFAACGRDPDALATAMAARLGPAMETEAVRALRDRARAGAGYCAIHVGTTTCPVEERLVAIPGEDGPLWVATLTELGPAVASPVAPVLDGKDESPLLASVAAIGVGLWTVDLARGTWTWSPAATRILGTPSGSAESLRRLVACIHPDDRQALRSLLDARDPSHPTRDITIRLQRRDGGGQRWIAVASRLICDTDGRPVRAVGTLQDVTDSKRVELEREASEARLNAALTIGRMVVWDLDVATGIVTRSANADEVLGLRREAIHDFFARVHPEDRHKVDWETADNPMPPTGDICFRYHHPLGAQLRLETSAIKLSTRDAAAGHVVGITTDVTARYLADEKLVYAANHDALTGLYNRKAWATLLDDLVATASATGQRFRLCLVDVDLFKTINDTQGHDVGDRVLVTLGERLKGAPLVIFVARLGGDEFAAVVSAGAGVDDGAIERCVAAMSEPVIVEGRPVPVTCSIGVAAFPDHARTAVDLAKHADLALYSAKQAGRRRAHVFVPRMREALDARTFLCADFAKALATGHVLPFYQPKLDLRTGEVVGFEALARWTHPERGLLTPATFGAIFEDCDLAIRAGAAIRAAVLRDIKGWLDRGLEPGRVAVNCTSHDFRDGDFAQRLLCDLASAGIPAGCFEVEVTESVMLEQDAALVKRVLDRLHGAGIKISLDDFGTGYASLIHLKRFPVDEIKIDCTFVRDMDVAPNAAIIRAIIAMGLSLGLTTVAEGVETMAQARTLVGMGCSQAQGFLLGKPMRAERVPWFIRSGARRLAPFARTRAAS